MKNLIIVSRDWEIYKSRFETNNELQQHFLLTDAGTTSKQSMLNEANVMIGEPDLTAKCVTQCKELDWLQSTWAGNNKLQALPKKDYALTGVKGVFGLQMVEYVLSYLLYFSRKVEDFNRLKKSHAWEQLPCKTLSNYSIGIMGLGSIGQELAQRLLQFNMTVNGYSSSRKNIENVNEYSIHQLSEFLGKSDFVINLLPETNATNGFCNRQFFSLMKQGSIFINAGRGSAVESPECVIEALNNKHLKAAVLDVFDQEPLPNNHPYYSTPDLYITCHTAAISDPHQVFDIFEQNAKRFVNGENLLYKHNFKLGY